MLGTERLRCYDRLTETELGDEDTVKPNVEQQYKHSTIVQCMNMILLQTALKGRWMDGTLINLRY